MGGAPQGQKAEASGSPEPSVLGGEASRGSRKSRGRKGGWAVQSDLGKYREGESYPLLS